MWPPASYFNACTAAARAWLAELELVERSEHFELYRRVADGTHWRIDADDRFVQRFLIRIDDVSTWASFDADVLQKALLLDRRGGSSADVCMWQHCNEHAINDSAFCLDHTYEQGIRK